MGFESGSLSFRLFHLRTAFTRGVIAKFAAQAAPPIETLGRDPLQGWVTGRHLLDRNICEQSCLTGSYLHVALMRAERKIPEALLRAYCRLEEEAELKARNSDTLPRQVRSEIRTRLIEQMQPTMPPTLSGMPVALDFRNEVLLAGAMSEQQIERLGAAFRETTGTLPVPLSPEVAALTRRQVNANDLAPTGFSPDPAVAAEAEPGLGLDFLTWLWFVWERDGGVFHRAGGETFGFMLEGPLTFYREGQGAHEALLRKGSPLLSREAGTALLCGKKLKRAKFTLARGEQMWSGTIDADFGFRSLKLPKSEQFDPVGRFEERMLFVETYWQSFLELFDRFLEVRAKPAAWNEVVAAIQAWIVRRVGK